MVREGVVISCEGLVVRAGETILTEVEQFDARSGQFWAITGANGVGKTTLLRCLIGRQALSAGSCTLQGEPVDLTRPWQRRAVASLVEPIPVSRTMTLAEQLLFVDASWRGRHRDSLRDIRELSQRLEIDGLTHRYPNELSAGQRQLFNLALTLIRPSRVLVLDEPERHLDDTKIERLCEILVDRARTGSIVVASAHNACVVRHATDRFDLEGQRVDK